MKAKPLPNRKDIERLAQEVQDMAMKCVQDNSALLIIALARRYGFRGKRLTELMCEFNAVRKEYEQHQDDDVFDIRIKEELEAIGIEPDQIYMKREGILKQMQRNKKRREHKQLGLKEQYELKKMLEEMNINGGLRI